MANKQHHGKYPPDDAGTVALFFESVAEHWELAAEFPTEGPPIHPPESIVGQPYKWTRMVRAASLRKFIIGKTDSVYIPTVVGAALRINEKLVPMPTVKVIEERLKALTVPYLGHEHTPDEVLTDFLYGTLLHADYGRRERYKGFSGFEVEVALHHWVRAAESQVRWFERVLGRAVWEGRLEGVDPSLSPVSSRPEPDPNGLRQR